MIIVLGVCALSSCSKKCDCKAKYNGEVVSESTVDLEDGKKCSDYNSYISILGTSVEMKCTADF